MLRIPDGADPTSSGDYFPLLNGPGARTTRRTNSIPRDPCRCHSRRHAANLPLAIFSTHYRLHTCPLTTTRLFSPSRPIAVIPILRVLIKEVTEDDWSDASSVASDALSDEEDSLTLYDPSQETFSERFYALKDMVPPSTRASIVDSIDKVRGWTKWSVGKVGQAAWITTTSALLVGLPLLLSIEGEAAIVQQEKEFLAQPGAPNPYGAPPAPGSAPAPQGVVPAGF